MRAVLLAASLLAAGCASSVAHAQSARPGTVIYPASEFASFHPRNALDIVERTPGFVLDEDDESVRGLAGSGSNILIDGSRPSVKSGGIREVLLRIPADQVEQVEVLRNANLADAQGQALVLNIVRVRGVESGTWSAAIERNGRGTVYPRVEVTTTRVIAGWETSLKLNGFWEEYPFETERLFFDPAGGLTRSQRVFLPSTLTEAFLSSEASRDALGGRLTLTGRFGRSHYYFDQSSDLFEARRPNGEPDGLELLANDSVLWIGEIGAELVRPLRDWTWTSTALLNADHNEAGQDQRTLDADDLPLSHVLVESSARPLEVVARSRFASPQFGRLRGEVGGEVAFNQRRSAFALTTDGASVPVPAANVRVQEWRGEAFANATYTFTEQLSLEGALAAEASQISVSGDADSRQDFTFLKPSLTFAWKPSDAWLFRAGARTTVSQLDFADFAASASLVDDQTQAGNPEIRPGRTVRYSVSADYRGSGDLAANIELFHEDREDVLAQILLPSGAPGLANAGDAVYRGLQATATLPLSRLLSGSRLSVEALFLDTEFEDPVTGDLWPISGAADPRVRLAFRRDQHDGRWSWGVNYAARSRQTDYLLDEFTRYTVEPSISAFVETRIIAGLTIRLDVKDIVGQDTHRWRTLHATDRSGPVRGFEDRYTQRGEFVSLRVSGQF